MIYRESGQFKTTYKADQAILPIFQDKVAMVLLMKIKLDRGTKRQKMAIFKERNSVCRGTKFYRDLILLTQRFQH